MTEPAPPNQGSGGVPATRPQREVRPVQDYRPWMDTAKFEHMLRYAQMMADASLVPEHLVLFQLYDDQGMPVTKVSKWKDRQGNERETERPVMVLDPKRAVANCYMIVEQADRWNLPPLMLAQETYITKGKIGYTGKLIQAVLERELGSNFDLEYAGDEGSPKRQITVTNKRADAKVVSVKGTVEKWATTTGYGQQKVMSSQWAEDPDRQLRYRGVREWARAHAPGLALGLLGDDELDAMREDWRETHRTIEIPSAPAPRQLPSPMQVIEQSGTVAVSHERSMKDERQALVETGDHKRGGSAPDDEKAPVSDAGNEAAGEQAQAAAGDQDAGEGEGGAPSADAQGESAEAQVWSEDRVASVLEALRADLRTCTEIALVDDVADDVFNRPENDGMPTDVEERFNEVVEARKAEIEKLARAQALADARRREDEERKRQEEEAKRNANPPMEPARNAAASEGAQGSRRSRSRSGTPPQQATPTASPDGGAGSASPSDAPTSAGNGPTAAVSAPQATEAAPAAKTAQAGSGRAWYDMPPGTHIPTEEEAGERLRELKDVAALDGFFNGYIKPFRERFRDAAEYAAIEMIYAARRKAAQTKAGGAK